MRKVSLVAAAVLTVCAIAVPSASARHGYWTDCGSFFEGGTSVIAHRVHCAKARRVMSTLYRVSQEAQGPTIRIKSFTCVDETYARRPFVCSHGDHVIRGPVPG